MFNYWLANIWFNNSILIHRIKNILLIMDRATTHFSKDLNSIFKTFNSLFLHITLGLTRYLQPLDVVINKPFKDLILKKICRFNFN